MSINDFIKKIKGKLDIDKSTFMCLCVVLLVGLGSFALGRISAENRSERPLNSSYSPDNVSFGQERNEESREGNNEEVIKKKMYLASKNGKLYYPISCTQANRISESNRIYFASSSDAEKSGYNVSSSCK